MDHIEQRIETGYQTWLAAPERKASGEVDFGAWWTLGVRGDAQAHPTDARWRVSWLAATGELYAVELRGPRPDRYIMLGYFNDRPAVELALKGWDKLESPIHHNLSAVIAQLPEI